jgi:hypothetical protein
MTCNESTELISAQLDDELSKLELELLNSHLEDCSYCQQLQQKLQKLATGFAQLPEYSPPPLRQVPPLWLTSRRRSFGPLLGAFTAVGAAIAACFMFLGPKTVPESNILFLVDGSKLSSSAPGEKQLGPQDFSTSPLYGTAGKLEFELLVDSQLQSCKALQLELDYDFDGDGKVDRTERYRPFATDSAVGWESYSNQIGLESSQGEMQDFKGGRLMARLINAPANLKILQGKSKIVVPLKSSVS